MRFRWNTFVLKALLPVVACTTLSPAVHAETDFGDVAMRVAYLLRNKHYSRSKFDDTMSQRVLDNYLNYLDFNRVYFTQKDIDEFQSKYGSTLDDSVFAVSIDPAHEMHKRRMQRVEDRIAKIKQELEKGIFEFKSDRKVIQSRKEAAWPGDEEAADQLWHDILEAELLQEQLRIEGIDERNAGKLEEAPDDEEESPRKKISDRYQRYLESLRQEDGEDIANLFLTALATAYDPHSEYFSQSELESFQTNMRKSLKGIGALLSMRDGRFAEIQGIVVGGPADKAGNLQVGDRIVAVGQDGEGGMVDITYMKLQKVVDMIRGETGSTVRLKIIPAGADDESLTNTIRIVRDEVQLKDKLATAELIRTKGQDGTDRQIGWIYLPSFYADMEGGSTSMTVDVKRLLTRLKSEGIQGLVIDVRGNGGGSLEEAINMTGLFIPEGPVVQSKNYQNEMDPRSSKSREAFYTGPLVVLGDRISASASEILAAALQDYNRALVVGGNSFGKGTVQTIYPVAKQLPFFAANKERAGAIKVTIQKFYRISGGSTQVKGVQPDVALPSIYDVLEQGESTLKHPLEWDEVKPLRYSRTTDKEFPLSELRSRSRERIADDVDFRLLKENMERVKTQLAENSISLNIEERRRENRQARERRKKNNEILREEYAKMVEAKSEYLNIYKLTLDNVDNENLTLASDFTEEENTGFRLGKNDKANDSDKAPDYPFDFDNMKRETLNIIDDIITLNSDKQTASVAPAAAESVEN
jgi:carboxyl-terminal processing protease